MRFDLDQLETPVAYKLLAATVMPRPIAWVTTVDESGRVNAAPYSFFNALASDPPMVMIAFNGYHRHGGEKDTLHNIKASGEFVVNLVPLKLKDAMNASTANVAPGVDEFELAGLTPEPLARGRRTALDAWAGRAHAAQARPSRRASGRRTRLS